MFNDNELALIKMAVNCLGEVQLTNQGHVTDEVQALIDKMSTPVEAPKAKKAKASTSDE
jgi:hypothetical protein